MNIKNYVILLLSLGFHLNVAAQSKPIATKDDTTFIEKMDQYLNVKVNVNNDIEGFSVNSNGGYLRLQPNTKLALKLSANYSFLGFSVSASPNFLPGNNDDDLKGTSKYFSFKTNLNFTHWIQNLEYNHTKGYYVSNTADFDPTWIKNVDPYLQVPALEYHGFKGQTAYRVNPRFSFKAISVQTERQLRSVGSFMPMLSYNYYIIDNKVKLTGQNSSQKSNNLEAILSIGYFHTFVLKHRFYFSIGTAVGEGFISTWLLTRLPTEELKTRDSEFLVRIDGGGALGYNGERFFAGAQLLGFWSYYARDKIATYTNDRTTFQIFVGYRFNAPKFLKRTKAKIEEKESKLLNKK